MDGSQDSLDAFHARLGVLTWRSEVSVKDLLRETLRRSTALRVTPANPIIGSMIYGCMVAEVTTFFFTSDTMQVFCERLQVERAYVAEAYAVHMEAEVGRLRLEAAAAAVAPPRPTAAHPQPAPVPQGPWPTPPSMAASSQPPSPYRRAHFSPGLGAERAPSAAVPPLGERQRRVTLYCPRPRQVGARSPLRPLRGSCLEDRPTRCSRLGTRQGSRPGSSSSLAARWGGRWRGAGLRPSARAPTRTSVCGGRARGAPRGSPGLRSGGARRRSQGAGDSRSVAGPSAPRPRTRVRGTDRCRPGRALCRPRFSICASGHRGGTPLLDPPGGRLLPRRLARLPTEGPLGVGQRAGPPPAGQAPAAAGDPGAPAGPEAPTAGGTLDLSQQRQLGFEHRPFGAGDPKGNSWSEKIERVVYTRHRPRRAGPPT